jgi:hypothetical protein
MVALDGQQTATAALPFLPSLLLFSSHCNRQPVAETAPGHHLLHVGIAAHFIENPRPESAHVVPFGLGRPRTRLEMTGWAGAGRRQLRPPKRTHQEKTMDHQNNPHTACVARARALLAAAALGVERLESAANLAFFRLAALTGMLARLERLGGSREAEAGAAAALDAATVCREAKVLLRYVSSRQWPAGRVVANGGRRRRSTVPTTSGMSSRGL